MPALIRVGHKGADLLAPGNTIASFEAAVAAGVDMLEFDVMPGGPRAPGELVLAHDPTDRDSRTPLTLDEGLEHLAATGLPLDVDLKTTGYEERVVAALHAHGVTGRSLVSSQIPPSLALVRAAEPALKIGWSVPRAKRDYLRSPVTALPAYVYYGGYWTQLPRRAAAAVAAGRCDAIMAHQRMVRPALVRAVKAAGGELYVWTVDDAERIAAFAAMGVTGVITNDPRLFGERVVT